MTLLWCSKRDKVKQLVRFAVAALVIWGTLPLLPVYAETNIVPWGSVREYFDSNVWRRPKEFLRDSQGNAPQLYDFVSTVSGGLDLRYESRNVEADLRAGGNYSAYVENSNLNFYGALLNGTVGLDRWVDQYVRGARLRVTESLIYTPDQTFGGRGSTGVDDVFGGGLVTFRRSMLRNTTGFNGSYPLSRDISLEGGYTFGLRRMTRETEGGDVTGATFFNTMTHTWYGGPRYKLTRNDSVAALYRQTFLTQERSEGGRTFSTNLISLEGDYTKEFPEWSFTVRGGITFVEPTGRSLPSGSIQVTTKPERDTVLALTLAREARPSFFLQGGARITNSARASIRHRIYERLSVSGSGGYTLSQFFPNTESQFQTVNGAARVEYMLTRNIRGELFYIFRHINSDTTALEYQVSRHQVGFMLSVFLESLGESIGFE
ncbi:MAG: outer membrane beta-barrel protein [Nitrospira sp.]|nr:outer membrane beta-barrel protein [Nitrospira sp.]